MKSRTSSDSRAALSIQPSLMPLQRRARRPRRRRSPRPATCRRAPRIRDAAHGRGRRPAIARPRQREGTPNPFADLAGNIAGPARRRGGADGLQQRLGGSCLHHKGHGIGVFMTRPRGIDMELFKSERIKGHCYIPRLNLTLVLLVHRTYWPSARPTRVNSIKSEA